MVVTINSRQDDCSGFRERFVELEVSRGVVQSFPKDYPIVPKAYPGEIASQGFEQHQFAFVQGVDETESSREGSSGGRGYVIGRTNFVPVTDNEPWRIGHSGDRFKIPPKKRLESGVGPCINKRNQDPL